MALALVALSPAALTAGFGDAADPTLHLSSNQGGARPAHRITLNLQRGDLELYRATLTYPSGFRFAGFEVPGAPVGRYEVDADLDGTPDRVLVLQALSRDTAYADLLADGRFDPDVDPRLQFAGGASFDLQLPLGGDARSDTLVVPFGARVSLVLYAGPLANPAFGGRYTIAAEVASVDPDTDGPDDGEGAGPITRQFALEAAIDGPAIAPFAALAVHEFLLLRGGASRDHFLVQGRFQAGPASDGFRLTNETVTLAFDGFSQTVPGSAFRGRGSVYVFTGRVPGIVVLQLHLDTGRFIAVASRLTLGLESHQPVRFTLRIGNDHGETTAVVRRVR